jgi:hypothetical protein
VARATRHFSPAVRVASRPEFGIPIHKVKQRSHVSSFPGHFSPEFDRTHCSFSFSLSSPARLHSFLSFSSPPARRRRARCIVSAPDERGGRSAKQAPGCREAPGEARHDRRAGALEAPCIRAKDARLSCAPRGDFCIGQRFAACGIPFGLAPAFSPSRSASGGGLGRETLRTGHYPKDRCPTSRLGC